MAKYGQADLGKTRVVQPFRCVAASRTKAARLLDQASRWENVIFGVTYFVEAPRLRALSRSRVRSRNRVRSRLRIVEADVVALCLLGGRRCFQAGSPHDLDCTRPRGLACLMHRPSDSRPYPRGTGRSRRVQSYETTESAAKGTPASVTRSSIRPDHRARSGNLRVGFNLARAIDLGGSCDASLEL